MGALRAAMGSSNFIVLFLLLQEFYTVAIAAASADVPYLTCKYFRK